MDSVDYIFIGILSFLTFICIIVCCYEFIPECIKYYKINTKDKTKINPLI
jgi:hypothetical protein